MIRSRSHIVDRCGRALRYTVALLLMLFLIADSAEAQRGKKPAKKAQTTAQSKKQNKKTSKKESKKETRAKSTASKSKRTAKSSAKDNRTARKSTSAQKRSASQRPAARERSSGTARQERTTTRQPASQPARPQESGPADLAQQTLRGGASSSPTKRPAPAIPSLTGEQLQAINATQQEVEGLPLRGYPTPERPQVYSQPFYGEASVGLYATGALRAGYMGSSWPYDYALYLNGSSTKGFVDDGNRTTVTGGARGGYVIGDSYGIFSGGHMGAEGEYNYDRYRRYAVQGSPERTRTGWMIGMNGQNSLSGTTFELNGRYRQLTLTDSLGIGEQSAEGSAKVRTQWTRFTVGGETGMRLTYLDGKSISFGTLAAYLKYSTTFLALRAGGTFGVGENSDSSSTTQLAPLAELSIFPLYGVTLSAAVGGGLSQSTLQGLLEVNPYVVSQPLVRHEAERIAYKASLRLEPWQWFGLRVAAARGSYDNYGYFALAGNGLFAPQYGEATITKITGDFYLEFGARDMMAAQATFMETLLDSTGGTVPYVPKWDAELLYSKRLASLPLTLTATARYIGARPLDAGGTLDPAVLLGLKGRYAFNSHFDGTLELNNIANQRYEIWPGYRERGFFGAIGIGVRY